VTVAPASKRGKTKASKAASGVIEIDLDQAEVRDVYDGDDPRSGFYTFELVNVAAHTSQNGNEGIRWIFTLADDPLYEGWTRFVYSNLDKDGTRWKTEEILMALKGGKSVQGTKAAQVRLDLGSEKEVARFLKAAKKVRGRVQRRRDSDDDDPEMELGKIIALDEAKLAARKAAEKALAGDEDDEDDEFEDAEEFEDADEDTEDDDEEEDDADDEEDSDDDDEDPDEDDDEEEDEDEDEDDEEEDEEDEPEPPKKGKKAAASKTTAKPAAKKTAAKVTNIADAKKKKSKK
jgi:hypothetical protein